MSFRFESNVGQTGVETAPIPCAAAADSDDALAMEWQGATLAELAQHIVRKHHRFVRQESVRLEALSKQVCDKHAGVHPELTRVADLFRALRDELAMHMSKEEQVLFPYLERLERAAQLHQPAPPAAFGSLANPIRAMLHEHDDAGSLLKAIRKLSDDYVPPTDSCPAYRTFYDGLQKFECDLHEHIKLENSILFPRALKLEEAGISE